MEVYSRYNISYVPILEDERLPIASSPPEEVLPAVAPNSSPSNLDACVEDLSQSSLALLPLEIIERILYFLPYQEMAKMARQGSLFNDCKKNLDKCIRQIEFKGEGWVGASLVHVMGLFSGLQQVGFEGNVLLTAYKDSHVARSLASRVVKLSFQDNNTISELLLASIFSEISVRKLIVRHCDYITGGALSINKKADAFCAPLIELDLSATAVEMDTLSNILKLSQRLKVLRLRNAPRINFCLTQMPSKVVERADGSGLDVQDDKYTDSISWPETLEVLDIVGTVFWSVDYLASIVASCPRLKQMHVSPGIYLNKELENSESLEVLLATYLPMATVVAVDEDTYEDLEIKGLAVYVHHTKKGSASEIRRE